MSRGGTLDPATVLAAAKAMPSIEGFPTVDELAAWFETLEAQDPDRVASSRIGSSRLGEPLRCVTIGDGSVDVVVVAGVHPNEPIGFRTIQQLATTLLEGGAVASLDVRWHLVPCIDPDGTRLNEGWFDGAGDRRVYARNFYRPAPNEQVEW
ncbi:MAG: peptidase, partial [Frondihabitans sp.]|nr:peptidase [Frondihabitans sp.]